VNAENVKRVIISEERFDLCHEYESDHTRTRTDENRCHRETNPAQA
jgi:hypothetical protein